MKNVLLLLLLLLAAGWFNPAFAEKAAEFPGYALPAQIAVDDHQIIFACHFFLFPQFSRPGQSR